jgi:hypothetical protein
LFKRGGLMFGRILYLLILTALLAGCISTGVSHIDSDENFDWNTLKRDQILMSPLVDLRVKKTAPIGQDQTLDFFSAEETIAYPEKFKQVFFRLRNDIRVFGAGGAFSHIASLENLKTIAREVIEKRPLVDEVRNKILEGTQGIRFIFFFAVSEERTYYDVSYVFRKDTKLDLKHYSSTREFTVKLALWDSKENKTVWIATETLKPTSSQSHEVANPSKYLVSVKGKKPYWSGNSPQIRLESEISENSGRFPSFPGREPAFSKTFDDFALALPIHPSEQKLIEYNHFTYHRPEAQLRTSSLGPHTHVGLQLGTSSVINYSWRVGGAVNFPLTAQRVRHDGIEYELQLLAFGLTFDYEKELTEKSRILVGVMAGTASYSLNDPSDDDNEDPSIQKESKDINDGVGFAWPRVYFLFGEKGGFQWGTGVSYRFFDGLERPELRAFKPSKYSIDLGVSYAFRGF